ncbi:MAG: hypothetical protein A2Y81_00585 [Nitrospirae bacterium RBG_13_43_8]|nr:MAG: hypothetical protein A2Y81_00585 [Nitrospirae bacterium RBG_13_43_8]
MQNEKLKNDKPDFLHFYSSSLNLNVPCSLAARLLYFCYSGLSGIFLNPESIRDRPAGMTTTSVQYEQKSQSFNICGFAKVLIL